MGFEPFIFFAFFAFTSPVAMSCHGVCAFVLLRCFSCSHTVLPKEHSLFFFSFSPHFPHVYAVFFFNSTCISLLIILCMIVCVTNNKEPNKEP